MKGAHIVLHIILFVIFFSIDLIDSFLKYFDSIKYKIQKIKKKKLIGTKYNIVSFQAYHTQSRSEDYEKMCTAARVENQEMRSSMQFIYIVKMQTEMKDNLNR